MIDGADDRDATRPGFPASIARARESLDFGHADTAPALAQGRGPGNEHVQPFHIVKPEPRHDHERGGCYDGHAHERLTAHDTLFKELWERVNGTTGADGVSQKQARYEQRLDNFEGAVERIEKRQEDTDEKLDAVRVNVAATHQAVIERGIGPTERALIALACLALIAMGGATAYRQWVETKRIEARP